MRYLLLGLLLMMGFATQAAQMETRLAGRRVLVWSPDTISAAPAPVLIFSHGFGGCAEQSTFLTAALAQHGYYVFAPDHQDASCKPAEAGNQQPDISFYSPQDWRDTTYANRRDDIRAILAAIKTDARFKDKIDFTRLGLVGHSLGGYTVLGLSGAWQNWTLPGVKAVLALAPYATPYLANKTLNGLAVPVMFQTGTQDSGITPYFRQANGIYQAAPAPKYYVEFEGAGHYAWTELVGAQHDLINEYSLAFLDHYVKGETANPILTTPEKGISDLRYESELGRQTSNALPQTTVQSQPRR